MDTEKGDFEWWYFDINDIKSGCFLKIVLHVGTDPLGTRIFPQIAISVNASECGASLFYPFVIDELKAYTQQCGISVMDVSKIWAVYNDHPVYFIKIDIPGFK